MTLIKEEGTFIEVTLAYAPTVLKQHYQSLQVMQGTTLHEALKRTGWLQDDAVLAKWCEQHQHIEDTKDIDKRAWRVGIYSTKQPLGYVLTPYDRIEVYRPLTIDPRNRRKVRASR